MLIKTSKLGGDSYVSVKDLLLLFYDYNDNLNEDQKIEKAMLQQIIGKLRELE